MAKHTDILGILGTVRDRNWSRASQHVATVLEQKVAERIAIEKQKVAQTLLEPRIAESLSEDFRRDQKVVLTGYSALGGYKSTKQNGQRTLVPKGSIGNYVRKKDATWSIVWFPEFYDSTEVQTRDLRAYGTAQTLAASHELAEDAIEPGDRVRTKKFSARGTVTKVENGNVHFALDEPEGKYGKRIWKAPLSNIVKISGLDEAIVSQHEVQRIYNEIGDIGETELLCGISKLTVNPQGQVISYISEAKGRYSEADLTRVWKYTATLRNKDKREYALRCLDAAKASGSDEFDDVEKPEGLSYLAAQAVRHWVRDALAGKSTSLKEDRKSGLPDGVKACGPDCAKGDDVDPDYYCGEGLAWVKHKGYYEESIQNPNSSGQGFDPDAKKNPFANILARSGYEYSHSTPVTYGTEKAIHHTYKRGEHVVSVVNHPRQGWVWTAKTSTSSGHQNSGKSERLLDVALANKRKRYSDHG